MAISDQQRIQIDLSYSSIAKTSRGDYVRKMLESHSSIRAATGKLWLNHLVYRQASSVIGDLIRWYLWVEDQHGPVAKDALNRYLECESVKTTFSVWVFGIKPEKVYHFNSISLVPVDEMPDSRERDEYMALIRNFESPVSYAAFTKEIEIPRVVDDKEAAKKIYSQLIQRSYDLLNEEAALVNGLNDLSCLPHWKCAYQDVYVPFGPWGAVSRGRTCFDIVGTHSRKFSDEDSEALREIIVFYDHFDASEKQWLQVILERIQKSKRQQSVESKILDLGIAAEMLLLKDLTERDPIAFPFRFRGSWLLGRDFQSREKIYETLKEFYGYRCTIAHDGVFKKERDAKNADQKLPEFYNIVEKILQLAIRPAYPRNGSDWLALILGKGGECGSDSDQDSQGKA